jgi:hypothetical protein
MGTSAYRVPPEQPTEAKIDEDVPDGDILVVFAVLWVASLVRVAGGLIGQETFGVEPPVALLIVVLLPVLTRDALRRLVARWLPRRSHHE